jgi:hypothetical protein
VRSCWAARFDVWWSHGANSCLSIALCITKSRVLSAALCVAWSAAAAVGAESATQPDELPLPLEYLAAHRELLLAYKLLEADGSLKVCFVFHVLYSCPTHEQQ